MKSTVNDENLPAVHRNSNVGLVLLVINMLMRANCMKLTLVHALDPELSSNDDTTYCMAVCTTAPCVATCDYCSIVYGCMLNQLVHNVSCGFVIRSSGINDGSV